MNKYLVVYQLPNDIILNKIMEAEKITEDIISDWEALKLDDDCIVTILNIIKLDE